MTTHTKKVWLVFAVLLISALMFGCGLSVNLTEYTDAMAEAIYTGSSEKLSAFSKNAVTDVDKQRNEAIDDIGGKLLHFIGISQPDKEAQNAMNQWVQKAIASVRVEPCIPGDDGAMTLVVHPLDILDIFGEKFHDYYANFAWKNNQSYYKDLSDSEFESTYLKGAIKILNRSLLSADTSNTSRLTISLTKDSDGRFMLEDESIEAMLTGAFYGYDNIMDDPLPQLVRQEYSGYGDYVQGLMDCMYLCDPYLYSDVTDISVDDAYEMYWNGLNSEAYVFLDYLGIEEVSDDLMDEIAYMLSYVYDYSEYYVTEGYDGDVSVTIYPMNIYLDTYDEVVAYTADFAKRNENYEFSEYTDEEFLEEYIYAIIDIFYDGIDDMTYADPVTLTVHVDVDSDGQMSISDDDFNYIDYYIINYELDEIQDADEPMESKSEDDEEPQDGGSSKSFDSFFNNHPETETMDFSDVI